MKHVRETPRPLPTDIPPAVRAIVERAMAKDPAARWPSGAALAAAARQAAAMLAVPNPGRAHPAQPSSPVPGVPAAPASPVGVAHHGPASFHGSAVPGRPPSHPPGRSTVARPTVAGVTWGGAALPPAGGQRPAAGYGHARPDPRQPEASSNRPWLIALAVVLGVLALFCAGVIALLRNGGNTNTSMATTSQMVAVLHQTDGGRDDSGKAPYRQVEPSVGVAVTMTIR